MIEVEWDSRRVREVFGIFFIPATMVVLLIKATAIGLCVAANYLKQRDFPVSLSYRTYLISRFHIEKHVRHL